MESRLLYVTCMGYCSKYAEIKLYDLFKALWTKNGSCIVYPCHAIIVAIDVSSGQQQFFMGHTDKVIVTMNKCIELVKIFFENTKFDIF